MKTNIFQKINIKGKKIAIVQARFNEKITCGLKAGAVKALKEAGVKEADIGFFSVPGSVEIPLVCQKVARTKKFDGIVALGAVVKGETAHFDYVAKMAADGIMKVMIEESFPIAFGVITVYDLKQAQKRSSDDKNNKGYEAALALAEVLAISL